jgi:hypothetical protein
MTYSDIFLVLRTETQPGRMAQVEEHLPSKCEALSSNLPKKSISPTKKERKLKYIYLYFALQTSDLYI